MGNTAAKAVRSRSGSGNVGNDRLPTNIYIGDFETIGLAGLSRKKREKEIDKRLNKEKHISDLIVRLDENVDGGYLAPYSNYKYDLSYKTDIVRDLIVERKLAPFYTPLEDYDDSWSDEQLLQYIKKQHLHYICTLEDLEDSEEDPDKHKIYQSANSARRQENKLFKKKLRERAMEVQNEEDAKYMRDKRTQDSGIKTFASLPSDELLLKLYRGAKECPICFLFYPKNLNTTRCCAQPICTECFVQMKRLDPHVPHDAEETSGVHDENPLEDPDELISEPVKCPFCAVSEFGVLYTPPDFKTGIGGIPPSEYKTQKFESISENGTGTVNGDEPPKSLPSHGHERRKSIPPDTAGVITIDAIRPDWEQKLLSMRAKLARRSAAATALHASSLIVEDPATNSTQRSSSSTIAGNTNAGSRGLNRQERMDIEQKMIEEAMRLSLLDEQERKMKVKVKKKEKARETEHKKLQNEFYGTQ